MNNETPDKDKNNKVTRDRKYKVFWGTFVTATGLLIANLLTGDQWVYFNGAALIGYMGGNVGVAFSRRGNR